ncbi:MAG: exopolysaccharide biosynthesis polyprenyl glycosylphosphotransferase [Algibacter sp.]
MKKRVYTRLLRPVLYIVDFLIVSSLLHLFLTNDIVKGIPLNFFWIVLSVIFSFEDIYRTIRIIRVVMLILKRVSIFLLLVFTYFYIIDFRIPNHSIFIFFLLIFILLNIWRIAILILIRKYKVITGDNYTKVVIIGLNEGTIRLERFFQNNTNHDYKYIGFFTNKDEITKLGDIDESFGFIMDKNIDEIYCSVKGLSNDQMSKLIYFADNNLKRLKFIPDNKYVFSKKLRFENYDLIPILSLSNIPLKDNLNSVVKRTFDIVFSLIVIIGFLSWFIPIIAILIKLESNGSVFFKQLRYGTDFNLFACYKFRSMRANNESDKVQAAKNDMRVTKIGKFIRKTSIDELPQFYNVLFGSMSVVGPRPLLLSHTDDFKNKINKFMVRHTVKPGITGLAQVSGYRGNIEKDLDMHNRVKYDVFYVENWSLFLDFKIIIKTVLNVIKGEDKAY